MNNAELARAFARMATMLEIDGANSFRVRAYREAARVAENHTESLSSLCETPGALEQIPGIGKSIAQHIRELCLTGHTPLMDQMLEKYPGDVIGFTELQGLGPKRVKTLFDVLGIRTREELAAAAQEGKLRDLPGFGEKVEQNVVKALASAAQWSGRMLLAEAWPHAIAVAERIGKVKGVTRVELAGSFRRRRETIGDLDVLVCGGDTTEVMDAFTKHATVGEVLGYGDTKSSVRIAAGLQVDLRLVPEASFGAAMLYFTGSKQHNIELRKIAIDQGMSLNEYALTRDGKVIAGRTEEEVYRALGLAWVPPELREALGEIEMAREDRLPRLIELEDLRADLHMHTTRTDGRDSIDAMVEGAIARGYEYMAITEHSKAIAMAFGFDGARVRQSVGEIAAARKKYPGIQILHGLEVDILAEGDLDLDDESLALLDWVIVSIHSRFDQAPEVATARALKAVSHPAVHVFGHPTGRLIGSRGPAPFDVERVVEAAAARGVGMEVNSAPDRLDLSDVHARLARTKGCRFVVDTDAHSVGQLDLMKWGIFQARRAGLTRDDVWNSRRFEEFEGWRKAPRAAGATVAVLKPRAKSNGQPAAARGGGARGGSPARIESGKPGRSPTRRKAGAKGSSKAVPRTRGKS